MKKNIYPDCFKSFTHWCNQKSKWANFYCHIGSPKPFDVTLRDGLQGLNFTHEKYNVSSKMVLYNFIYKNFNPKAFEIGSFVSPKVLPIFEDTKELLKSIENDEKYSSNLNYILVPNLNKLETNLLGNNFSFITSLSNSFQLKNTKMTLNESYEDIYNMLALLDDSRPKNICIGFKTKLYVSCFTECPIEGKININDILQLLFKLNNLPVDSICLSDTCGTLNIHEFRLILYLLKNANFPLEKLSLHLHVDYNNEYNTIQIIHEALDNNIIDFDVSLLHTGGCSVTMDENKIKPNLSYELYYRSLVDYIIKKT